MEDMAMNCLEISIHQDFNSLHAMHLYKYIGACVTEVNCEADRFLEWHWILFPAVFMSGCGLHT